MPGNIEGNLHAEVINDSGHQSIYNGTVVQNYGHSAGRAKFIGEVLRPVQGATYQGSKFLAQCHQGTRKDVIKALQDWVDLDGQPPICWLSGPAGYGKSAISRTIAETYDNQKRLLGNVFFRRGYDDKQHIGRLIPSLSHQLYHNLPKSQDSIHRAIDAVRDINTLSLEAQFRKLIIEPIQATRKGIAALIPLSRRIIIIDALDECDDKDQMKAFIDAIIHIFQTKLKLHLRILITSRVEEVGAREISLFTER
ncbi:hypothetical protein H0H81_010961 [Sphagnurus paluster]|uniref:Nephrocystin 3-like N-terminal domain-containing protein n=1 Tax=Sphagnurus paluster TaxID=117069 RepID=A0A9P7GIV6_9AGAR|nr:hypothetical protein H0H81_010961 [Sphagnurus paluster]